MAQIITTEEFMQWYEKLNIKEKTLISARFFRIESHNHFGDCKLLNGLSNVIAELRWKNGLRIYFYKSEKNQIIILIGGKKNDQKRDIKKAEILFRKYACNKDKT